MLNSRSLLLNKPSKPSGDCVVYVMSRDQRVEGNHALRYAQSVALEHKLPMAVVFVITAKGHRSREHYRFMLDGLKQVEDKLNNQSIPFILMFGDPQRVLANFFEHTKPRSIVFDFSPLSGPRILAKNIATITTSEVSVIDTHNIVPVWVASDKQEIGARTLRRKIHSKLIDYLNDQAELLSRHPYEWPGKILTLDDLKPMIEDFLLGRTSNGQTLQFESGEKNAKLVLEDFITNRLFKYSELRNDPSKNHLSGMSPYLHYGQISSQQVSLRLNQELLARPELQRDVDALIEEMVVRKELSDNYCFYSPSYRNISGAPQWARNTLEKHGNDPREFIYDLSQFESASTHDTAWNAAQTQLRLSGKIHGYMRMYWAKKVLEWSRSPSEALETLIYLNDFYSIDGGDPNGYTGIMWSVCGVHDRPWRERLVYGTIRSMVYSGLKRKFDIVAYEEQWGTHLE